MLRFMPKLKLEQLSDAVAGGAPATTPPSAATEKETDDFGYEVEAKADAPKTEEKPAAKPEEEKPITAATGYDTEPKVEEKPEEKSEKKAEEKPEDKDALDIKVEGLPDKELAKIKEFAKEHKVPKEIAEAYAKLRKSELEASDKARKEAEAEAERQMQATRKNWYTELKNDPKFGGENFARNTKQVEKVMEEFMPNTKKVLTERKGMLPPYFMRDLAAIADQMYSTEKLKTGDASVPPKDNEEDDALAFYN